MGIAWYTVHIQYSTFLLGLQDCIAGMKDKKKIYDKKIKPPCGGIAPDGSDGGDEAEVLHNHRMQHHFFTTKPKRTCRRDIAFSVIPPCGIEASGYGAKKEFSLSKALEFPRHFCYH